MNGFGHFSPGMQQFEKAKQIFDLNINHYPESSTVYDSLGDYFAAINEK